MLKRHCDLIGVVPHHYLGLDGVKQLLGCNVVIVCKYIPVPVPDVRCKVLEDFLQLCQI